MAAACGELHRIRGGSPILHYPLSISSGSLASPVANALDVCTLYGFSYATDVAEDSMEQDFDDNF